MRDITWCVETTHSVALQPVIEPGLAIISASKLLYLACSSASCDTGEVWLHLFITRLKL